MASRAVITGIGVLAPNGNSLETFWENTLACKSGVATITRFPTDDFPVHIAAEVKNFDLKTHLPEEVKVKERRLGLHTRFGIAAAHQALRHAGLSSETLQSGDVLDVLVGVSTSAMEVIEHAKDRMNLHGLSRVSPTDVSACQPHAVACSIVDTLNLSTRRSTFSSACPAGLESIARARTMIASGESELVLCGGMDAPITPLTMASMHLAGLAQDCPFPPEHSSRPYDAKRMGGIIGEGAAMFVVESLEHALSRGAAPLAELVGYGSQADDVGAIPAAGLANAIQHALADGGLLPTDIDYINGHGPSHPVLDEMETRAIKQIFGPRAYRIPVSSIKGVIGNPLAAAGPLQVAASVMALRDEQLPPTANYEFPDPACDLSYIPNRPLHQRVDTILINLHGLGGGNSCLILRRVEDM